MSQTALDIITDAFVEIGAYSPGDTIAARHAQLGLLRFQNQLDSWQADQLSLNLQTPLSYTMLSGSTSFTIGPTGNVVSARPTYIEGMNYLIPGTTPPTEVPMGPMDSDQYMALSQKTLPNQLPQLYYLNATMPNATVIVWPQVSQNVGVVVYVEQGIDIPATLTTVVSGPQGYAEAFMYQLALRLVTPWGHAVPPLLPGNAAEAFARMKRPNVMPGVMGVDSALVATSGGYNVLNDSVTAPSNR